MEKLLIIILILLSIQGKAQEKFAYRVSIDYGSGIIKDFTSENTERVNTSVKMKIGQEIDAVKLLSGKNVFFEYKTNSIHIYVEKKLVVIKNGKKKYKTIKYKK